MKDSVTSICSRGAGTSFEFSVSTRTDVITSVPPFTNRTRAEPWDCIRMFVSISILLCISEISKLATGTGYSFFHRFECPVQFRHK